MLKIDNTLYTDRKPAWREAGTTMTDPAATVSAALGDANLLDWDLRKVPLVHVDVVNGAVPVPGSYVNLRNVKGANPRALGVVGDRYWNIANETVGEFIELLLAEESGIYVDAAGAVDGGSRVFLTLGLEDSTLSIGGFDQVAMFLTAIWSHDGSTQLVLVPMPTRLSCTNQIRGLLGSRSRWTYKVRHLSGAKDLKHLVPEAQKALGMTKYYITEIAESAELQLATPVDTDAFEEIIKLSFPEIGLLAKGELEGRAHTMATNRRADLLDIWTGPTILGAGIGNTAWGASNAIGELVDWGKGIKGDRGRRGIVSLDTVEGVKSRAASAISTVTGLVLV